MVAISRRRFVSSLGGLAVSGAVPARSSPAPWGTTKASKLQNPRLPVAPLYCVAYITPNAPGQEGQEAMVARYPLAIVPQDDRRIFKAWRDSVTQLNSAIVLLGYQAVHEESFVPGPGHDLLRKATNSWCRLPNGSDAVITEGRVRRRLYDPRTSEFADRFTDACRAVLSSYPFDGIFLDNCTIFPKASADPDTREKMREGLQRVLLDVRRELPKAILIGNCRENWAGLNGEMNEGRPEEILTELASFAGHSQPSMDMYLAKLANPTDQDTVRRNLNQVLALGSYYGASVDYTHVVWFEEFDRVIQDYARRPQTPSSVEIQGTS